ncbi:MAG: phosphopantetheine-binding protein, partial [Acidobacteria bacterium]|nr:phosphopantetheine-binding protein [Acidobacteriota bacterium]
DGEIEYLGRIDHQVKIRGFRIELGEIEAAVREQAGVRDAVVIASSGAHEEKHLVAYVVVEAEATVRVAELRQGLRKRLPEYMVPSAVVLLEEFPLTPSGKLDREALPAPDAAESEPEREFAGARDINELQLTEIWEDVLGVQPVSVRDNFFELGGHSIMAVRLMARIQQQFGLLLPLATLIEGATIEQLAAHLRQETGLAYQSSLVKIRSGGLRPPFFCIHPAGGNVLCYADLARYLGSDQPFYGLQAQGLNGVEPPLISIENMAARYLDDVRRIQPQGPYLLGGWSMGGTVAFEMARQLQSLGQSIALLALFDTRPYVEDKAAAETDDVALLGGGFAQDMGLSFDDLSISQDELLRLRPDEQLAYLLQEAKKANIVPPDIELRQVQQIFEVFKTNVRALRGYVPQTYAGRVTLFKAAAQEKPFPDEVLMAAPNVNLQQRLPPSSSSHIGSQASRVEASQLESSLSIGDSSQGSLAEWSRLATEGVETYTVPGTHLTMIREPHVRALAAQLKSVITKALPDNGLR